LTAKYLEAPEYVPEILGQHHGFSPYVSGMRAGDDNFGGAGWQSERERLIKALQEALGETWPQVESEAQARLLAGLTSVADWIGSGHFFEDPLEPWQEKIQQAVDDAGFIPPTYKPGLGFKTVFRFEPRQAQALLIEQVSEPGVYVLEAPMGLGKTEAALYAAYQMLAKGHDFANVTLVIVVNADGGLFSVDFRAPEQLTQVLLQVSGRAGRGEKQGQVLVQTCHSDHPLLKTLCHGQYLDMADQLLAEREAGQFPPFRAMAIFRAEGDTMETSLRLLDIIKPLINVPGVEVWGPLPALIARRADRYRAQLVLNTANRKHLNTLLANVCAQLDQQKLPSGVKWMIDVDPQETG